MATVIRMPQLDKHTKFGVITKWHKAVGDFIKEESIFAEIEIDGKALELSAIEKGHLLFKGNSMVKVNDVIAVIGQKDDDYEKEIQISNLKFSGDLQANLDNIRIEIEFLLSKHWRKGIDYKQLLLDELLIEFEQLVSDIKRKKGED